MKKRIRKNRYKSAETARHFDALRWAASAARGLLVLGSLAGISLLFIFLHDALTQSSYFRIRVVTVAGNERLSEKTILDQAAVKLEDSILSANLGELRYRLLSNPWIAAAEVQRELPDKIHIRVEERRPLAILNLDRPYYMDDRGEIFKPVEASDDVMVPMISGLRLCDIDLANPWRNRALAAAREALRLSEAGGTALPTGELRSIHVDNELGLTLFAYDSNLAIKLGYGDFDAKYKRLGDMMSYLMREDQVANIECVDLNHQDRIVIRSSDGIWPVGVSYRKEM